MAKASVTVGQDAQHPPKIPRSLQHTTVKGKRGHSKVQVQTNADRSQQLTRHHEKRKIERDEPLVPFVRSAAKEFRRNSLDCTDSKRVDARPSGPRGGGFTLKVRKKGPSRNKGWSWHLVEHVADYIITVLNING